MIGAIERNSNKLQVEPLLTGLDEAAQNVCAFCGPGCTCGPNCKCALLGRCICKPSLLLTDDDKSFDAAALFQQLTNDQDDGFAWLF